MASLTIGKVARLAGVGVETIRFYEREGLIDEPPRKDSGYRQYPEIPSTGFVSSGEPRSLVLPSRKSRNSWA